MRCTNTEAKLIHSKIKNLVKQTSVTHLLK